MKVERLKKALEKKLVEESTSFTKMAELLSDRERFRSKQCSRAIAAYKRVSKKAERLTLRLLAAEKRQLRRSYDYAEIEGHLRLMVEMEASFIEEQEALLALR